jgi:hypothetical protein
LQDGDIGAGVAPRILFVFESVVAGLTEPAKFALYKRAGAWRRALRCWEPVPMVQNMMWDISVRYGYMCDVVSYLPDTARSAMKGWLDERGYPYGNLYLTTVADFTRTVVNNPSVYMVYEADEKRRFAYGAKSVFVSDPAKLRFP